MLKNTYKILGIFAQNPTASYLFMDVKKFIGSKSESYTYNSLKEFVHEGIVIREKRGGVNFYSIAQTPKAISFLSMAAEYKAWKQKQVPKNSVTDIAERMDNYFSLLVVGSYVKNRQKKNSDLDIVLIVPMGAKRASAQLRHFCEMNIPPIHLHVFASSDFKKMLLDSAHNFGKESAKENLIFFGAQGYYRIVFEAMKNGFTY